MGYPRRRSLILSATAALWLSVAAPQANGQSAETAPAILRAEAITEDNAAALIQQGPDAIGGIGDWHLSNGTLCATISALHHESDISPRGGALVDLGYCDRADDQLVVLHDLRDGSLATPLEMDQVAAQVGTEQAAIISTGNSAGLVHEIRYRLDRAQPSRLRISKRIRRTNDDAPGFRLLVPLLFNYYSMETFLLSSTHPERSTGFAQIGFSSQGVAAFADAARRADTIVALGAPHSEVPVTYGWRIVSARKREIGSEQWQALPRFAAADGQASVFLVLADPFFIGGEGELGRSELLQIALMGLEAGEELELEEELWVSPSGDVAGITNQLYADAPWRTGAVTGIGTQPSAVEIEQHTGAAGWAPFSFVSPDPSGGYRLRLPSGRFRFTAKGPANARVRAEATLTAQSQTLPTLALPASATLTLPTGTAMRLIVRGRNDTPDPHLQDPLTGYTVSVDGQQIEPPEVPMVFLAGIASDRTSIALPPGDYRVYATRGIEYELTHTDITVQPGQTQTLSIDAPERQVATPGYIAADLHVHSAPSMDNGFSSRERVRTFVAEHGEVMVATEHETLFDFTPLLRDMQVTERMIAINGTEMTGQVRTGRMPHTAGHANFFPLQPRPTAFRRGVPANEGRRLREILHELRTDNPQVFAQLNHTRGSDTFLADPPGSDVRERIDDGAYFDHMGPASYPYDPGQPLTSSPNNTLIDPDPVTGVRDIDFDAMEILNGAHDYSPTRRRALLADWMSLLLQGERLTGTANSDSHGKSQQVALPRNMVAVAGDSIATFKTEAFIEALRKGRSYGTTGPLLNVDLDGVGLGAMVQAQEATLNVAVTSADWIPADSLRVVVNGEVVASRDLTASRTVSIPLIFQADSFVLVEVEAEPTDEYRTVFPGHRPYAFSNPIYVDADGDGQWQPPGLTAR